MLSGCAAMLLRTATQTRRSHDSSGQRCGIECGAGLTCRGSYGSPFGRRTVTECSAGRSCSRRTPARRCLTSQPPIEWGAETWGLDLDEVHLTRTDGKSGRREDGVVHHRGQLAEDDVVMVNGVRVTLAARAAAETCTIADVERSLVVTNSLLHLGPATMQDFDAQCGVTRNWPRSLTTELVRRLANAKIESVAESRAFHLFWHQHIPRPEPQVEIFDEHGRLVGRVDFAWAKYGVFGEIDGKLKYFLMRRAGETSRRIPAPGEASRGTDLPDHRVGLHPDHLGGPRPTATACSPDPQDPRVASQHTGLGRDLRRRS